MPAQRYRVAFYGAIFYPIVSALRSDTELDVDLFIDSQGSVTETILRELGTLEGTPWLHADRWLTADSLLRPWRAPVTRALAQYDAIVAAEHGPIFARSSGRPYSFFPIGGDLTVFPFPLRSRHFHDSPRDWAIAIWVAGWQRRAIRGADEIWCGPWKPFLDAMARLGIDRSKRAPEFLPIGIESRLFDIGERDAGAAAARTPLPVDADSFVVFHPSRLMMRADPFLVSTGQWKANEVLFHGFKRFIELRPRSQGVLALIDQQHSPDRPQAMSLCRELRLDDHVSWLRPPAEASAFSWSQMKDLYLQSDVVADDFGSGWFGNVVVEALALGKPVITHLRDDVMAQMYRWHPVQTAATPDEVTERLLKLYDDPTYRRDTGEDGIRWVDEFHGKRAIAQAYGSKLRTMFPAP